MKNKTKQNILETNDIEDAEESLLSRDSVKNTIFEIAVDMFTLSDADKENFEEMELECDVKCDTLDIVEFVMNLEDEFGVIIGEDESDKLVTFEDCIDLVWGKIASDNDLADEKEE